MFSILRLLPEHLASRARAVAVLSNHDVYALEGTVANHTGYVHILNALDSLAVDIGDASGHVLSDIQWEYYILSVFWHAVLEHWSFRCRS